MEVKSVIKLKLCPNEEIARILDGQSRIANWLYNHLLEKANELKEEYKKSQSQEVAKTLYSKRGLRNLLPELKKEHTFLKSVHSSPLKNTALRASSSIREYQKSQKGKRKGKKVGWPKFRSWKARWFSLFYDEPDKGYRLEDDKLCISLGMGEKRKQISVAMPIKESNLLCGQNIRNLRIVKRANVFSAVFTVTRKLPKSKLLEKIITLDPNHQNLAYGVDNSGNAIEIESPEWLKTYDKRIDELKAKRDRCKKQSQLVDVLDEKNKPIGKRRWKSSRRWEKFNNTLQKALAKRREQTKTFLFTVANKLSKDYDLIAIGNYTPHGNGISTKMRRAMNNRSVIGRFKNVLSWTALKSGRYYDVYNEKRTTKTCYDCGYVVKDGLEPSQRNWTCPKCESTHIRDENAAKNGMTLILREWAKKEEVLFSVPCSGRVSVSKRWTWRVRPSGIVAIPRGSNCGSTTSDKKLK